MSTASYRKLGVVLAATVLAGCRGTTAAMAQDASLRADAVDAIWSCREHVILRNRDPQDRRVVMRPGSGATIERTASGRNAAETYGHTATIVVLDAPPPSLVVEVQGQAPARLERPADSCVRNLPDASPDSVDVDYIGASANASARPAGSVSIPGVVLLTFKRTATRRQVDSLIAANSLTLIGGRPSTEPEATVWGFWIPDGPRGRRTDELLSALRRSPVVASALPYITEPR